MSDEEKLSKLEKCRYHRMTFEKDSEGHYCTACNLKHGSNIVYGKRYDGNSNEYHVVTEEDCENCSDYKSMYIEYPLTIDGINIENIEYNTGLYRRSIGRPCKIRPCGDEYKNKTYLGLILGALPLYTNVSFSKGYLNVSPVSNPAIFVFELKKIIFGSESWWSEINNIDDLKEITDSMIENQWYVKLLKELMEKDNGKSKENSRIDNEKLCEGTPEEGNRDPEESGEFINEDNGDRIRGVSKDNRPNTVVPGTPGTY